MSDRQRLIEFIKKSHTEWLQKEYDHETDKNVAEYLADHLLANGVIVPPCKVGDTVYYIVFDNVYRGKCHAITQHDNRLQIHLYDYDFDNASIKAENVFLTREEAEQALKECEQV